MPAKNCSYFKVQKVEIIPHYLVFKFFLTRVLRNTEKLVEGGKGYFSDL